MKRTRAYSGIEVDAVSVSLSSAMALYTRWKAEAQARSSILSVAIQSTLPTFGHTAYYSIAQAEGVEAALQSQDVSAYIPTRYGKSLVYQMLPLSARYILESLGKSARLKPCMRTEPLVAFLLMSFTSSRFTNTLPGCVRFANLCWRLSHR